MYRGALTFYLGKAWRNRGMEDWRSANFLSFHVDGSEAEWRHLRARNDFTATSDIEMTIRMSYTYGQWAKKQDRLEQLGFSPDPDGHSLCSCKRS